MLRAPQKVMPILWFLLEAMGYSTSCVGERHPRGVPMVDPPCTLGWKTLYELASLKYCYNAAGGGRERRGAGQQPREDRLATIDRRGDETDMRTSLQFG